MTLHVFSTALRFHNWPRRHRHLLCAGRCACQERLISTGCFLRTMQQNVRYL